MAGLTCSTTRPVRPGEDRCPGIEPGRPGIRALFHGPSLQNHGASLSSCLNPREIELTPMGQPAMMDASRQLERASGERHETGEEEPRMDTEMVVTGAIVDS